MSAIASLVVGRDGSTSLNGNSQGLSTPADRARFLALHRSAPAIVIGSNTATHDPYSTSRVPVYVFTREERKQFKPNFTPIYVPTLQELEKEFRRIAGSYSTPIVVEAGASLLQTLINLGCIDFLYLSIVPISPQENQISMTELLSNFTVESEENIEGTRLLKCRYQSNATDGKDNS